MLEPVAKLVVNFADDFGASGGEILVRFGRFVDENEGGFVANADAVKECAFKTGFFNEPARIDFITVVAAVDRVTFVFGGVSFVVGEVDILEEGAGAGGGKGVGKFVGADTRDDIANALGREIGTVVFSDIAFDRIVKRTRHLALF